MISFMQPKEETRRSAILLLGPTGAGKTPLGRLMEERSLWGLPCLHFDFGHELRRAAQDETEALDAPDREIVVRMLKTGALLEEEHFYIARRLLDNFILRNKADKRTLVVLNGFPRHEGQAEYIKDILRVIALISLGCAPETVMRRIDSNAGGDRTGRIDDSLEEIKRKLEIFSRRTAPLLEYYRSRHAGIIDVEVGPLSTASEMLDKIEKSANLLS
jgi:adenylate kinase family enzyme